MVIFTCVKEKQLPKIKAENFCKVKNRRCSLSFRGHLFFDIFLMEKIERVKHGRYNNNIEVFEKKTYVGGKNI